MGSCNLLPQGQAFFAMFAVQICEVQRAGQPGGPRTPNQHIRFQCFPLRRHLDILLSPASSEVGHFWLCPGSQLAGL